MLVFVCGPTVNDRQCDRNCHRHLDQTVMTGSGTVLSVGRSCNKHQHSHERRPMPSAFERESACKKDNARVSRGENAIPPNLLVACYRRTRAGQRIIRVRKGARSDLNFVNCLSLQYRLRDLARISQQGGFIKYM